jgi:Bacterial protein of unknown function (Gcw_chp)
MPATTVVRPVRRALRLLTWSVGALLCASSPATAQLALSADVGFNSHFVWRGVTSTNRFVMNPEFELAGAVRGLTLTVGGWGNIEPARYDGSRDLSSLSGLPGPFVTQSQAWANIGRTVGILDAKVGVTTYIYPHVADLAAQFNTTEVYGELSADVPLQPSLMIAYDADKIRGTYLEGALAHEVAFSSRNSVAFGLVAGFSAGQARDPAGRDAAYFERDGLTHVEGSVTGNLVLGAVTMSPGVHVIVARDALARVTAPNESRRVKLWVGSTLSWSATIGRGTRQD